MHQEVKEFFTTYERTNSASDTSAIGDLYAATFMFGGANGVQAVTRENLLKVIPRMKAHLSAMGLFGTKLRNVEVSALDSKYLLATADWTMNIRGSSGTGDLDASATYVLMRGEDGALSIVFQIDHQDLATLIRNQQI